MITTYHNISFGTQTVPEQIPVVQGDTGREIVFILTDFTIPEGATATYYVQKPSGEAVYNSATISENNIIVPLTAQSIIEVGENDMQVRVILDEDIVTSFRAILMVRPFLGIGAVESSTEINIFDQAVEDAYERITEEVVWPANFYGTCQTAAATQDKTVTVQGGFILKSGVVVNVMCAFTNSASQITLNVNNTGAKAVYYRGSKVSGDMLVANGMYTFVYANSHWNLAGLNGKLLQLDDTLTVSGRAADSKATGDRLLAAFATDTASGAIATFSDGADGVPVKALTVEIEPVQSGSGDPSPTNVRPITGWSEAKVTRTGKNLLKVTATSDTVQGVTFTVNSDGTVLANGSVVGGNNINFLLGYVNLPTAKNLTINGAPSGATASTYYLAALNGTITQEIGQDTGSGADLGSRQSVAVRIRILTGTTLNNALFKPMIRFTSDADATFEPFGDVFTIDLDGTRYGGTLDVGTGVLTVTDANIVSYNGETLPGEWISDRDVYAAGTTPTTGAQVVYKLAIPLTVQLTAEEVTTLLGQNNIFADCGDVTCQYRADTKLYIDKILNA